ncbi:hypothetical protein [Amniculibacterium sp. G2-70]|nr:hypothetical protein [Amniculibacterium sp. G2-70]
MQWKAHSQAWEKQWRRGLATESRFPATKKNLNNLGVAEVDCFSWEKNFY